MRALLLGSLHGPLTKGQPSYLSNQMPRTYASKPDYSVRFWTERGMRPRYVDLLDLVQRKADYYLAETLGRVEHKIICADSRAIEFNKLGATFMSVVTSPPYYGMRTYVPDQWLRNWFVGGHAAVEYRQPKQLDHHSPDEFARQLSEIWSKVADACAPGASMLIRFGGIQDRRVKPKDVLIDSLRRIEKRFRLQTICSAGTSIRGKRQANQFQRPLGKPLEELDYYISIES
ncbi:MAG: hypothetical protein AAFR97_02845 [Bacteroidota bacterium]